jgi:hypothetical protein
LREISKRYQDYIGKKIGDTDFFEFWNAAEFKLKYLQKIVSRRRIMEFEVAKKLYEVGHNMEYDIELYEEYSGRNMYGKTTTAIVIGTLLNLIPLVGQTVFEINDKNEAQKFIDDLENLRSDQLGQNTIVY